MLHRRDAAGDDANLTGENFLPGGVDLPNRDEELNNKNLPDKGAHQQLIFCFYDGADTLNNRSRANIYVGDIPIVAIGGPSFHIENHGDVHRELTNFLKNNSEYASLIPQEKDYVAGYEDGKDIIISVRVPIYDPNEAKYKHITERELITTLKEKYRKAFLVANSIATSRGGQVTFETTTSADNRCVMMLGELHRLVPLSSSSLISAKQYIKKCTETIAGGEIYAAPWGSRFKSATQIEKSLKLIDKPLELLEYITGMHHTLSPERTSLTAGVQEAVFLVINPNDGNFNESFEVHSRLYDQLTNIKDLIHENIDRLSQQWIDTNSKNNVKTTIEHFVAEMRAINHQSFRYDNLNDPNFTRKLNKLLRGHEEVIKVEEKFTTAIKALDIGRFDENGIFIFSREATEEQKAIVRFVLENYSEHALDWLSLCVPLTPLTPEHRPSQFIKLFGNPEDKSYILLFGRCSELDEQIVIRLHPFGRSYWERRIAQLESDPATTQLAAQLTKIGSVNLVKLMNNYHKAQVRMYNRLAYSSISNFDYEVPPFEPHEIVVNGQIEDIQMRPGIPGINLFPKKRIAMQAEEFLKFGTKLGVVSVPNHSAQRPNVSLHELLVVKSDNKGHPEKISSIGTSESFSNSFGAKSANDYLEIITPLYGGHLASWLATFRYGEVGSLLDLHEIRAIEREFLQNFKAAFVERYNEIKQRKDFGQSECAREYEELTKSIGVPVPDVFNPVKHIGITEELLELDPELIADDVIASARDLLYCYTNVVEDIKNKDEEGCPIADRKEDLINSVCTLISNHCCNKESFKTIRYKLLSGSFDYTEFSMTERQHLLTVADISALLVKVAPNSTEDIYRLALETGSAEEFVLRMNVKYGDALFQEMAAKTFHSAINGLKKDFSESEDMQLKERLQRAVKMASFGTLNLNT